MQQMDACTPACWGPAAARSWCELFERIGRTMRRDRVLVSPALAQSRGHGDARDAGWRRARGNVVAHIALATNDR
jgi:hypothetical protein